MSPGKEASRSRTAAGRDFGMPGCWGEGRGKWCLGSRGSLFLRALVPDPLLFSPFLSSPMSQSPFPGGPQPSASELGRGSSSPASSLPVLVVFVLPWCTRDQHLWYCSPDRRSRQKNQLRCWYIKESIRGVSKTLQNCEWQLSGSCQTAFNLPSQEKHPLEVLCGDMCSLQGTISSKSFFLVFQLVLRSKLVIARPLSVPGEKLCIGFGCKVTRSDSHWFAWSLLNFFS